jgi:hypothetical protein
MMSQESIDLRGFLARNSRGHLGIISGRKVLPWGESYIGVALDGYTWSAREPQVLRPATFADYQAALTAAANLMIASDLIRPADKGGWQPPTP